MICSTAGGFLNQDALPDRRARKWRLDALDAVLHFHRRRSGIRSRHEIGDNLNLPECIAGRFEIQNTLGAVEFLSISRVTLLWRFSGDAPG